MLKLRYVVYPIMTAEEYNGKLDLDLSILVNDVEILKTRTLFIENEAYCVDLRVIHVPFNYVDSGIVVGRMID